MGHQTILGITFGKWLRQQRRTLDLTQQDLANQVGCARITLRRIESDALKPSKELVLILLEKVGIPKSEHADWLPFTRGLADLPAKQANPSPPVLRNNLPAFLTTFIGREKEQADVINLITKHRLVTLTGSGGVGKTRLSIQVTVELLSEYPIGIWLVELAPLTDPALVPQSVCAALGVKPEGNTSPLEALTNYLRSKKILLVMDNCEHLIDACAQLCDSLLRSCSELRILASSRESMGIGGEHSYRVPSLSLPNSKYILQIIQDSEAVELFMERATASLPEFELTEFNASFVAQICQRLDGIALAIELAASRVKMFKVEQIAARLDNAFGLLTGGARTVMPRHQTLRALIDWSYNLLSEEEKIFLRKLSVFMGGWTLEAAEAVCGNKDALELLTHLVDKSLVSVDHEHGNEVRYYLLETIRQYANEKLVESKDVNQLQDAHLDYFLKLAERIEPELYHRKIPYWLDYLETDYANFQAALKWAQDRNGEAGLRLCNALFRLWLFHGELRKEGLEWFEKFINFNTARQNTFRTWAHYHAAKLLQENNIFDPKIKPLLDESLSLAREIGDHSCIARILQPLGNYEVLEENFDNARTLYEESISEARLAEDDFAAGNALLGLGISASTQLDHETALSLFEKSLTIFRNIGELRGWHFSLNEIGIMYGIQGDWNTARGYYEESLALAQESHDRLHTSFYLINLGALLLGLGDFDNAFSFYERSRELVEDTPDDRGMWMIFLDMGDIARLQGNYDKAMIYFEKSLSISKRDLRKAEVYNSMAETELRRNHWADAKKHLFAAVNILKTIKDPSLWFSTISTAAYLAIGQQKVKQAIIFFGWADGLFKLKKLFLPPVYQAEFDRYLDQAREGFSETEFDAAWAEGQSMSQEQVLALAMNILQ